MSYWTYSANRKKHQRRLNHYMRALNKNIETDTLWRGRFVVRQDCAQWLSYEDHSGYELYAVLKFVDKKTKQVYYFRDSANSWCFFGGHKLWECMNWFIAEHCDVWANEGRENLYSNTIDWTKVEI